MNHKINAEDNYMLQKKFEDQYGIVSNSVLVIKLLVLMVLPWPSIPIVGRLLEKM